MRAASAAVGVMGMLLVGRVSSAQTGGSGTGTGTGKVTIDLPADLSAPEVTSSASPSAVKLGQRFTVFVTAIYGAGVTVNLREPIDLGGAFEISRRDGEDHERSDGRHVREWQLEVYAWELGELAIPPIAVTFTVGGRAGQVETNAVPVRVTGELDDLDDPGALRGDAPPASLVTRDWFWLWVGGGVCIGIAASFAYVWQHRRRRRRVGALVGGLAMANPPRIDMTGERALERLLAIERSGILDRDDDRKAGYAEMARIIRDYLGARYALATRDLTTAELLRALVRRAGERELALVERWLASCDIVKYGGSRATAAEAHAELTGARELVMATTVSPAREAA